MASSKEVGVNEASLEVFADKIGKDAYDGYDAIGQDILKAERELKDDTVIMGPIADDLRENAFKDYNTDFKKVRGYFKASENAIIDDLNSYQIDDAGFARKFVNASQYKNLFRAIPEYVPPKDLDIDDYQIDFINSLVPYALEVYERTGILPSVCIAQACKESEFGTALPGGTGEGSSNNYFGIKATPGWEKVVKASTGENYGGKNVTIVAGFRAYDSLEESVMDYGAVLGQKGIPAYENACKAKTYQEQARYIGPTYATGPNYAESVISDYIQQYNLDQFDPKDVN